MIRDLLIRKPGNEVQVLKEKAETGLSALQELVQDRNSLAKEVQDQRGIIDRLTIENESLRRSCAEFQQQRDFALRANARLEAHLNQLGVIIQTMFREFSKPADVKALAERFAPEVGKNAKSVA